MQKDVKDEGRTGDMFENKGGGDKIAEKVSGFVTENTKTGN